MQRSCGAAFGWSSSKNRGARFPEQSGDSKGGSSVAPFKYREGTAQGVPGACSDHDESRLVAIRNSRISHRSEKMVTMGSDGYDAASVVYYQQRPHCQAVPGGGSSQASRVMQKVERWVFLYNVTTGLYMLDWWERCIFNVVFLVFFLVACYNSGHYVCRLGAGLVAWCGDDAAASFAFGRGILEGFLGGGGGGGVGVAGG